MVAIRAIKAPRDPAISKSKLSILSRYKARASVFRLGKLRWKRLDLFKQRCMVVDSDAVNKKDDSAGSGYRNEHPGMNGESKDSGKCLRCAMADERGLTAHSKGPIAPGELGNMYERFANETASHAPSESVLKPTS